MTDSEHVVKTIRTVESSGYMSLDDLLILLRLLCNIVDQYKMTPDCEPANTQYEKAISHLKLAYREAECGIQFHCTAMEIQTFLEEYKNTKEDTTNEKRRV